MHYLLPFASALGDEPWLALKQAQAQSPEFALRHLAALLSLVQTQEQLHGDEFSLTPPHEQILAQAWGWTDSPAGTGTSQGWPFAAHQMRSDGLEPGAQAWGLITPCHWHVGREQISMLAPDSLALAEAESRAFFQAVRPLFEEEGFSLQWGAPLRWYLGHASLTNLPTASLDRVIGRPVDHWLQPGAAAEDEAALAMFRRIRRLQSEVQMVLHEHPLNRDRESRGAWVINSFWLSGCGREQPVSSASTAISVQDALRGPALQGDWLGWAQAWAELDRGWLREQLHGVLAGQPLTLTLCGERHARTLVWSGGRPSVSQRTRARWAGAAAAPRSHGTDPSSRPGVPLSLKLGEKLGQLLGLLMAPRSGNPDPIALLQSL